MKGKFMFLFYLLLAQCTKENDNFLTPKHTGRYGSYSEDSPRKSYSKDQKENAAKSLSRRIYESFSEPDEKKSQHIRETYDFGYWCPICLWTVQKPSEIHITCHQGGRFKHGYHFQCYKKWLEFNSKNGKTASCTLCRKELNRGMKKARSDFDISYYTDSSVDSSFVQDRYDRHRNFRESNVMQILSSHQLLHNPENDSSFYWQQNDVAQYSEPFPLIDNEFQEDRVEGCSVGRYRFRAGNKIVPNPAGNVGQYFYRTTRDEIIDIVDLRLCPGICVFGKLRNENGWIAVKNLLSGRFYGDFLVENFFTSTNLNDEQFRTHANVDSEAVGVNVDLDSFDNVVSDTNYENSFSFDSLSNTQLQETQNQSYQPDLSLGEYIYEGAEDELDKEMRRHDLHKNPFKNNEPKNEKQSNQDLNLAESKYESDTDEAEEDANFYSKMNSLRNYLKEKFKENPDRSKKKD